MKRLCSDRNPRNRGMSCSLPPGHVSPHAMGDDGGTWPLLPESVGVPVVARGALVLADLAWIESVGSPADKTQTAVKAYLWAVQYERQIGCYPSLNELRAQVISAEAP